MLVVAKLQKDRGICIYILSESMVGDNRFQLLSMGTDLSQSPSFLHHGKFTESSAYMYDVPYRQNTPIDGVEKIEKIQNQIMENIRRLSEVSRLLPEFTQLGSANSSLNEIVKSLMIQMMSNCNQKKENMPIKNDKLPVGFRISLCEKCLSGCHLRPILSYRILGFIKTNP